MNVSLDAGTLGVIELVRLRCACGEECRPLDMDELKILQSLDCDLLGTHNFKKWVREE